MIVNEENREEKLVYNNNLDVNKPLCDQYLFINKKANVEISENNVINYNNESSYSNIDKYLKLSSRFENKRQNLDEIKSKLCENLDDFKPVSSSYSLNNKSIFTYTDRLGLLCVQLDAFEHVQSSLKYNSKQNMIVEYMYDCFNEYLWYAYVKQINNDLVYLKYVCNKELNHSNEDSNDSNGDFNESSSSNNDTDLMMNDASHSLFCSFKSNRIKHIGWSETNGKRIKVPECLVKKFNLNEIEIADNVKSKSLNSHYSQLFLNNGGLALNQQLKVNQILELQDAEMPVNVWFVEIRKNIGGRLLLSYLIPTEFESSKYKIDWLKNEFWLFYLDVRLHPVNWAESNKCTYSLPRQFFLTNKEVLKEISTIESEFSTQIVKTHTNLVHHETFKHQEKLYSHRFQVGHLAEILYENKFFIAIVVELIRENYFKVKLDVNKTDFNELKQKYPTRHFENDEIYVYCNSTTQILLPIGFCEQHNLKLQLPHKWPSNEKQFNLNTYLKLNQHFNFIPTDASLFSHINSRHLLNICDKYKVGSYLEVVNPLNNEQLCVGQIKTRLNHLIYICINDNQSPYIYTVNSFDLFPIGWSEINSNPNYLIPKSFDYEINKPNNVSIRPDIAKIPYLARFSSVESWCNCIYINTNCYYGQYLLKEKLIRLPKSVGPGPISLTVSTIIQLLVNSSIKPTRTLKQLQMPRHSQPRKYMIKVGIKAKEKGKTLIRQVEICTISTQLNAFLYQLSLKLNYCLNFLSFNLIDKSIIKNQKCSDINCNYCTKINPPKKQQFGNNINNSTNKTMSNENSKRQSLVNGTSGHGSDKPKKQKLTEQNDVTKKSKKPASIANNHNFEVIRTRLKTKIEKLNNSKEPNINNSNNNHNNSNNHDMNDNSNRPTTTNHNHTSTPNSHYSNNTSINENSKRNAKGNPAHWSIDKVCAYLVKNDLNDPRLLNLIRENEFDGQSFMLLDIPHMQRYMNLKVGMCVKLASVVEKLKIHYLRNYVDHNSLNNERYDDDDDDDDYSNDDNKMTYEDNGLDC